MGDLDGHKWAENTLPYENLEGRNSIVLAIDSYRENTRAVDGLDKTVKIG
jgi:hypothetical protein